MALGGNLGSRTLASQEMTLLEGIPLTPQEFTCLDFTIVGSFVLKEPFDLSQDRTIVILGTLFSLRTFILSFYSFDLSYIHDSLLFLL